MRSRRLLTSVATVSRFDIGFLSSEHVNMNVDEQRTQAARLRDQRRDRRDPRSRSLRAQKSDRQRERDEQRHPDNSRVLILVFSAIINGFIL